MSTTDIIEAAFVKLNAFSYSPVPVLPVLYPGLQATPPNTGIWLEVSVFPNETVDVAWDNDSCVDTRGFVQILVCFRPGQGVITPSELADALIAYFEKGSALGPVRVLKRPWQMSVVADDASKLFIPVTIPYKGLT